MSLGDTLRRAREARRISLNQAALETRIRQAALEALEDGDYASLPPRPFLRGLLRNYALYLHLDADSVLDDYDAETGHRAAPSAAATASNPTPPNNSAVGAETDEAFNFPPFQIPSAPKTNGGTDATSAAAPMATIFQVAPELEATVPLPAAPLNLSQEPPTFAQRIGSTRIPEVFAIIAIAIALFALVSVGMSSFQNFSNSLLGAPTPRATQTATATIPPGSTPTGIPTLAQTSQAGAAIPTAIEFTPTVATATEVISTTGTITATATIEFVTEAQMTLTIEANGEMGAWIIVDEAEAFNGTLKNESRTFTARSRLFVQIKNVGNGRVFFQGTRILPRNQTERGELYRAWLMNPLGTPVIIPPTPYPSPIAPTNFPTLTPLPTQTPTRTATQTATITPTLTPTSTQTATATRRATSTRLATRTATTTRTASRTATATQTATRTATRTNTATKTVTRTLTP